MPRKSREKKLQLLLILNARLLISSKDLCTMPVLASVNTRISYFIYTCI